MKDNHYENKNNGSAAANQFSQKNSQGAAFQAVSILQKKAIENNFSANNQTIQKQSIDEEPVQGKFEPIQMVEDEEPLQGKFAPVQMVEEEEPIQGKFGIIQKQEKTTENKTGLPDNLKSGIENLSGVDISDVKVNYNSDKPAQLNAHAFAQGNQIHVAPGQEKHLPHEAWHTVQQKQGRVQPTMQMKEHVPVNDDPGLEQEADVMGAKAMNFK